MMAIHFRSISLFLETSSYEEAVLKLMFNITVAKWRSKVLH